ncbi:hypothetical protein [Bradyrhizobium cenepequi]
MDLTGATRWQIGQLNRWSIIVGWSASAPQVLTNFDLNLDTVGAGAERAGEGL